MLQVPHFAFKYACLIYCQRHILSTNISRPSVRFQTCRLFKRTKTRHLFVLFFICSCNIVQLYNVSVHATTKSSVFHQYFRQFSVYPRNFPSNSSDHFGFFGHRFSRFQYILLNHKPRIVQSVFKFGLEEHDLEIHRHSLHRSCFSHPSKQDECDLGQCSFDVIDFHYISFPLKQIRSSFH